MGGININSLISCSNKDWGSKRVNNRTAAKRDVLIFTYFLLKIWTTTQQNNYKLEVLNEKPNLRRDLCHSYQCDDQLRIFCLFPIFYRNRSFARDQCNWDHHTSCDLRRIAYPVVIVFHRLACIDLPDTWNRQSPYECLRCLSPPNK